MAIKYALWSIIVYLVCTVPSAKAINCKGSAKYTLTFKGEWSSSSHPKDFPSNPHFSSLVGCSHNASYVMWRPGEKASTGVKNVAETGSYSELNKEMDNQISSKKAHIRYRGAGISPGTASRIITNIEVTSDYPLVSFITMIAPSPDWFVGVRDFDLCNTTSGEWLDSRTRDLPPYDSGTDSGLNFKSSNDPTIPPENIHLLTNDTEGSFKGDKPVQKFGTFTFVKTSEDAGVTTTSAATSTASPTKALSTTPPKEAKAKSCKGWAEYTLTFKGEWSSASHPKDFPSNPHFSSLVGCSHNASYVMWRPGEKASTGVKNVAETGSYSELNKEMDNQISSKKAHIRYRGAGISPGTASRIITNIEVTSDYPLVSFITMIAPSPDWFVGVRDFDLCNTTSGEWLDSRARDLPPYDSGTDSGLNFKSSNDPTIPPENIHLLTNDTEGSFKGDKPVQKFGTFTFKKTFDSNPIKKSSSSEVLQPSKSQYQPNMPVKSSDIAISHDVMTSSTPLLPVENIRSTKQYVQTLDLTLNPTSTSTIIAMKSSSMKIYSNTKDRRSSSQQADMEHAPSAKTTGPAQMLNQTATITATFSSQITPTFSTTSGTSSVEQFSFIYIVFSLFVNLLL
ncbi:cell wall protein RBR3-like [Dendronephthya gigantea]|uniref:cell wall protein RBR3-like n=1 Tax=Dendronephthya gigantea TaxID=151771 RepID=UPI00106C1168|nr:cell wall protein RBR3-like [Dendronephthya gigantea]